MLATSRPSPRHPAPGTNGPQGVEDALHQRDPFLLWHGWDGHPGAAHELDDGLHHPLCEHVETQWAVMSYATRWQHLF